MVFCHEKCKICHFWLFCPTHFLYARNCFQQSEAYYVITVSLRHAPPYNSKSYQWILTKLGRYISLERNHLNIKKIRPHPPHSPVGDGGHFTGLVAETAEGS